MHPEDERYKPTRSGKTVKLPLCDREIPDHRRRLRRSEFGTGCVKVTPAHDFNDYAVGSHGLPLINILTLDATIDDTRPPNTGLDRFDARQAVVADPSPRPSGKTDKHKLKVPRGDRTGVVIEPMLTDQWFVAMSKPGGGRQVDHREGPRRGGFRRNHLRPGKLGQYLQPVAQQHPGLVHLAPALVGPPDPGLVRRRGGPRPSSPTTRPRPAQAAAGYAGRCSSRDPDVLTPGTPAPCGRSRRWTGPPSGRPRQRRAGSLPAPTVLVTGFDIIFFWVARMVMMTKHTSPARSLPRCLHPRPHPRRRGQKMSKSKGNVLDPIDLIDGIGSTPWCQAHQRPDEPATAASHRKKTRRSSRGHPAFGTDALRFTFASLPARAATSSSTSSRCEGYRNFCNKLWNATRFVLMNCEGQTTWRWTNYSNMPTLLCPVAPVGYLRFSFADRWIVGALQRVEAEVEQHFAEYRFDLAQAIYQIRLGRVLRLVPGNRQVEMQQARMPKPAARRTLVRVLRKPSCAWRTR